MQDTGQMDGGPEAAVLGRRGADQVRQGAGLDGIAHGGWRADRGNTRLDEIPGRCGLLPTRSARDDAICALYRKGATLRSIGDAFGLSYEGVRKVAAKAGLTKRNAGLTARKAARPAVNKAAAASTRTYGCSPEELNTATANDRQAFLQHRKNVRRQGVDWHLSLNEWCDLWRTSGKRSRRGQGPDKYGITRIDFDGPLELGNVEIVTNREAVRRARLRSSTGAARLPDDLSNRHGRAMDAIGVDGTGRHAGQRVRV